MDVRLKELLTEYAANLSVDILEMEIMPDHVHMLLEVDPQFGIHKAVKLLKKISEYHRKHEEKQGFSRIIRQHVIFFSCLFHVCQNVMMEANASFALENSVSATAYSSIE